jgi:hypothetical protein
LLFAGDFDFAQMAGVTFVGGAAGEPARRAFGKVVSDISGYYSSLLGQSYGDTPVFLTFESVSRDRRPGVPDWQFVTWPTIAMAGKVQFDSVLSGQEVPLPLWTTLSHEMAHYYFGTTMKPTGPLRWFGLESLAEFLSLKAVYHLRGDVAGTARLVDLAGSMGAAAFPTLDRISDESQISGTYRYQFAPVFLHSLEKRVGEVRMMAFLKELLATPATQRFDFELLVRAATRAGIEPSQLTSGTSTTGLRADAFAEAAAMLPRAAADPSYDAALYTMASALINSDTAEATRRLVRDALVTATRSDSTNLGALYQLGKLAAVSGRFLEEGATALQYYVRKPAAATLPSHANAYWRLGMIEELRGNLPAARTAYVAAVTGDPSISAARDALTRLKPPQTINQPRIQTVPEKAITRPGAGGSAPVERLPQGSLFVIERRESVDKPR